MTSPLYMIYSLVLVGGWAVVSYKGYSFDKYERVDNVPRSIRNNPGAYRPHYSDGPRYTGGK